MAVEIAQLKKLHIPKVTIKRGEEYNFFYVYFNAFISDRRNRLIVYFTPTTYRTKLYAIATIFNEPSK
jgi:hypothetical protein